jgi:hypothetical protein
MLLNSLANVALALTALAPVLIYAAEVRFQSLHPTVHNLPSCS